MPIFQNMRCVMAGLLLALLTATLAEAAPRSKRMRPADAQGLPEIRTSEGNRVPACVTPRRLMTFLTERNPAILPKFRGIADYYKEHGERLGVRWDFAFFQMIIETNYLLFRNASGRGDVREAQNNFAGIGTTGGGVPGDRFPDVSSGVLGQMQHLVAYSGHHVDNPVATRTREKQDDIIAQSRRLNRPVTFRDLAGRWAADRRYGRSIAFIAERYRSRFCSGGASEPEPEVAAAAEPARDDGAHRGAARHASAVPTKPEEPVGPLPFLVRGPAEAPRVLTKCKVFTASYGGDKNVLIRQQVGNEMRYTALQVVDGRETSLTQAFIRSHAQGGEAVGQFANRREALRSAFGLCPEAAAAKG